MKRDVGDLTPLRVCIVGGIFGRTREYQNRHSNAPEIVLASGLRAQGWDVTTVGHEEAEVNDCFDVVHVHHAGRAAYLFASASGRSRFVFTGHNGRMLTGTQISWAKRCAFRYVVRRCDAAVALTTIEEQYLRGVKGGQGSIHVIPNGIGAVFDRPSCANDKRSGLLYVGQLTAIKGVDVLLRAFAQVPPAYGRLTLAYHNPMLERELKRLALELGIARRVEFIGAKSPFELAELYAHACALVLPSHAESLPSVITEAMLAGTPVVASAVGGVVEQLNGFGWTVRPGDVDGLAAALSSALSEPPSLAKRQAMQEHARTRYTVAAMVRAHAELYRDVVAGGVARAPVDPLRAVVRRAIPLYWRPKRGGIRCA